MAATAACAGDAASMVIIAKSTGRAERRDLVTRGIVSSRRSNKRVSISECVLGFYQENGRAATEMCLPPIWKTRAFGTVTHFSSLVFDPPTQHPGRAYFAMSSTNHTRP